MYSFRDGVGIGNLAGASDVKYHKFIEAHINKSPANPDSSTVSMSDLLSRYRTFAMELKLPFHFSKDDKALKRVMVDLFGEPTIHFPSIEWSGIVLVPSVAENVAPSIFVQTETQAEAFAKLGNLDAEQIAEQMANLDDEIFQFADDNGEGAGEVDADQETGD